MSHARSVTRRRFLKGTAAAAVAAPYVLTSSALGAGGKKPASERIVTVSIGIRNRGSNLLGACLGDNDCQVLGICDVDDTYREKGIDRVAKHYGHDPAKVLRWKDYHEVMARDDVDAVVIATPDHTHAIISIAACQSGKDVYCEKPMTLTIADGRAMAEAVRRHGRVLQVGSQRRTDGRWRHTCELLRNGRIGKLHTVNVNISTRSGKNEAWDPQPVPSELDYDLWLGPAPYTGYHPGRVHYNFRFVTDFSGGDVTNWGAHFLDVAQWGIGADESGPLEVEGTGRRHPPGSLHDCFFDINCTFKYAGGVTLNLKSGRGNCTFIGTEGQIPGKVKDDTIGPGDLHLYRTNRGQMGDFLHCVRTRKDPAAPVETGHRSSTVCHLANIAMTLGRKLKWDPVKEEFVGDDEANRMRHRPYRAPYTL